MQTYSVTHIKGDVMASKTHKPRNRKPVSRQTRHFQLRRDHPVDQHVAEILDYKRSKRAEVTAIRDGVRLLWALENNDLSVLFELFPHLKTKMGSDGDGGLSEIKSMLEIVVAQKTSGGYLMQSAAAPALKAQPVKAAATISPDAIAANMLDMFD
jgi:hypothetical protein